MITFKRSIIFTLILLTFSILLILNPLGWIILSWCYTLIKFISIGTISQKIISTILMILILLATCQLTITIEEQFIK